MGGGGPRLGKNSHIFPFFLADVPKGWEKLCEECNKRDIQTNRRSVKTGVIFLMEFAKFV